MLYVLLTVQEHKLYEFIGENCVIELLNTLKLLAGNCSSEMEKHTEIEIQQQSQMVFNVQNNVIYVMVNLLNQIIKLETTAIEQVIIEERHIQHAKIIIIIMDIYP